MVRSELENVLNYHHLRYFWLTVREGGIAAAARRLMVSQPAVSGQIHSLERTVGRPLFHRHGNHLTLTATGEFVFGYAQRIFGLGQEMVAALRSDAPQPQQRFTACSPLIFPNLLVEHLLQPLLPGREWLHLTYSADGFEQSLRSLVDGRVDVLLSLARAPQAADLQLADHRLAQGDISVFVGVALARRLRSGFPRTLEAAPMVLPPQGHPARRAVDRWLGERNLHPTVVGEADDFHLQVALAQERQALFVGPNVIDETLAHRYRAARLGDLGLPHPFYAIYRQDSRGRAGVQALCRGAIRPAA